MTNRKKGNDDWVRAHRRLLQDIQSMVSRTVGPSPKEIRQLEKRQKKILSQAYKIRKKKDLLDRVKSARVVLGGDFHADPQSQRTHLRILRELQGRALVLGIEMFNVGHQKEIDQYLNGKISEKKFLEKTRWKHRWGFSWNHFRPLFELARENGWRIVALNPNSKTNSIRTRDRFAAKRVSSILKETTDQVYVVIGELHLIPEGLPAQLKLESGVPPLVVHINSESVFLDLVKVGRELDTEVVEFHDGSYCIQNAPPWMRWIQYLIHLEHWVEDESIHQDHVHQILKLIERIVAQELRTSPPTLREVYLSSKSLKRDYPQIKRLPLNGAYLPEVDSFFVPKLSVNKLSGFVGACLVYSLAGQKQRPRECAEDFLKLIWIETWSAFVSRIINPSRPALALTDLQAQARQSVRVMDVLKLCLSFKQQELRFLQKGGALGRPEYVARHRSSYQIAAEVLGGQIGQKLFWGYRVGLFSRKLLLEWMGMDFSPSGFESGLGLMLFRLARLGVVTKTKRERL